MVLTDSGIHLHGGVYHSIHSRSFLSRLADDTCIHYIIQYTRNNHRSQRYKNILLSMIRTSFSIALTKRCCIRSFSNMKGKVVVISGASSGIGEELGKLFSSKGANVVLSARRAEKLHDVARQCIDIGAERAEVISCDVSKEGDCKQLIAKTVDIFGQIDMLILNAGVGQSFFLEAMSPDVNIHQYMDVNYYGAVFPTISALPYLHSTNGRIVVVSSLGGLMPFPRQTLYNASKYALLGFFESLRMELLSKGSEVSVTIVCPGFVKTEITSGGGLGRDGKPIGKAASQKSLPGVKMISAKECAEDIAKAAESRTPLRVTPYWYTPILLMRKLFPNLVDKILVKIFSPSKNKKSTV